MYTIVYELYPWYLQFDIGAIGYIDVTAIDIDVAVFTATFGDKAQCVAGDVRALINLNA